MMATIYHSDMRKILFRSQLVKSKKYIIGSGIEIGNNKSFIQGNFKGYKSWEEVKPESVGQYVTTTNDIQLFEGMRIQLDDTMIGGKNVEGVIYFNQDPTLANLEFGLLLDNGKFYRTAFLGKITVLE